MPKSKPPRRTGSTSSGVKIPGGYAHFFTYPELSPRRQRALSVAQMQITHLGPKLKHLQMSARVLIDDVVAVEDTSTSGRDTAFTKADAEALLDLTDTAAWVFLKSWTLRADGQPRPLPTSVDDVLDLEPALYTALTREAAVITKGLMQAEEDGQIIAADGGFSVDSLPDDPDDADPNLPT